MELLRFATAGSVDDGKSTLIGRLLYDSKQIFEDQIDSVERTSAARGDDYVDLALLTDGLRAEREQGITIDVAYRYFATPKRKFIIADTPGHIQHTRNMVTGSSTADLVLVLVDARSGITEQTRRHASIAALLRIPHLVVCINKMDLVSFQEQRFIEIREEFSDFSANLGVEEITYIPISALEGDNVVTNSHAMDWYVGPSLLQHLEDVEIDSDHNFEDPRFPVQRVVRPHTSDLHDYRGYAGQIAGGVLKVGDEVLVLPSGKTTRIQALETMDGSLFQAFPPMSVVMRVEDDLDISRGDLICTPENQPLISQNLAAVVCWMAEAPLRAGKRVAIKHTTRWVRAVVQEVQFKRDVNTLLHDTEASELALNDIGGITLKTTEPLFFDPYQRNRTTGSFIIVDESSNVTVAAGMLTGEVL
ncbi:MAG TPA: GTP-binding protein [Acidimicrobiales bacterium]|nr:GTP-binding protein [Acidimicrobiales bacterium]